MESSINIWDIIWGSGIVVKAVLLILIGMSIFTLAVVIRYLKLYKTLAIENKHFDDSLNSLQELSHADGLKFLYENAAKYTVSPHALLFRATYSSFEKNRKKFNSKDKLEQLLQKNSMEIVQNMDKERSFLANIASTAPFIGLFGTVWGIINAFTGLSGGGGSIEVVAPGIAEALVATAVGLAAAIPASWFFNYFSSQLKIVKNSMLNCSQEIVNLVERLGE
jgi:biopolymer transport protein TolQ